MLLLSATQPGGFPALADGETLVLGETHGSNEIPTYFLGQVRREIRRRPVTVGLEISPSSGRLNCRSSDPARLPPSWTRADQDGRSSRAMRDLLCALRRPQFARRVRVVFLDDEERGAEFDRRAAARFRQVLSDGAGIGLILTGSFHARNNAGSLATQLRELGATVQTVVVSAPVADVWQCSGQAHSCGVRHPNINFCSNGPVAARELHWFPAADPRFAWAYCLSMPRLTPSLPAMTDRAPRP